MCCTLVLYGFAVWAWPEDYTSPAYQQAFTLMKAPRWGALFFVIGLLGLGALLGPRPYRWRYGCEVLAGICQFLRIGFVLFWTLLLFISVSNFEAGTRLGPVVWVALAIIDFSSVVRFGTGKADGG